MKRVFLLQLLVVALVWIPASLPQASILRTMTLRELVASSDRIVLANVISVQSAWDPSHRKIVSSIDLEVEQTWKGEAQPDHHLRIVQPGGTVGEIEMTIEGMPSFAAGERAVLFLRGRVHPQVLGLSQGKRTLQRAALTGRWVLQSSDMTAVVEAGKDARLRHARPMAPVDLDDFHAQVESLLRP